MRRKYLFLLLGLLLFMYTMPVAAAERVDTIPATKPVSAARFEIALLQNNRVALVGKGEMASANRGHFVLKTLAGSGMQQMTVEIVVYDGTIYTRENDSTQWYIESSDLPVNPPSNSTDTSDIEGTISLIGNANVAGTATNQYQVWVPAGNGDSMDHLALDFFIGQQVNYLYQLEVSAFTNDSSAQIVYRFLDFDSTSIAVAPPAGAVKRPASVSDPLGTFHYNGPFSLFAVPLSIHIHHS